MIDVGAEADLAAVFAPELFDIGEVNLGMNLVPPDLDEVRENFPDVAV